MKKFIVTSLIVLSVVGGLAASLQKQSQNPQSPRRSLTPDEIDTAKSARFNKFVALLASVGITVDKSYLHDSERDTKIKVINIKWEVYKDAPEIIKGNKSQYAVSNKLIVKETKVLNGHLPKLRDIEINNDLLLVAAIDEKSRLVWWGEVFDPRILYMDGPNPDGSLGGGRVTVTAPVFSLHIPDEPRIKEVRLYEFSKVNGNDALTLINSFTVNQ